MNKEETKSAILIQKPGYTNVDYCFGSADKKKTSDVENYVCFSNVGIKWKHLVDREKFPFVVYLPCLHFLPKKDIHKFYATVAGLKEGFFKDVIEDFDPDAILETGEVWVNMTKHSWFRVVSTLMLMRYPSEMYKIVGRYISQKDFTWKGFVEAHQSREVYQNSNHWVIPHGMDVKLIPEGLVTDRAPKTVVGKPPHGYDMPGIQKFFCEGNI